MLTTGAIFLAYYDTPCITLFMYCDFVSGLVFVMGMLDLKSIIISGLGTVACIDAS